MLLNKAQLEESISLLEQWGNRNYDNLPLLTDGICGNLSIRFDLGVDVISNFLKPFYLNWKYYSGNEKYPVPSTVKKFNARYMYFIADHWDDSSYADFRRDLCLFLAKQFKLLIEYRFKNER